MSKHPNAAPENIFAIDLNLLKPFLVDLPPGATIGMRKEQEGWKAVEQEIIANQPKHGGRAGITATDFQRFVDLNGQYAQVLARTPAVAKGYEVLVESLAHVDNQRHRLAAAFANAAEGHAHMEGGNPTLSTAYAKTIAYRSASADKAAKTRKKNEEAKSAPAEAADGAEQPAAKVDAPAEAKEGAAKGGPSISRVPNPPPDVIFAIDLTPLKPFLVDLPPRAMKGMRREQEGWEFVQQEIVNNQPAYGDRAGITEEDFARFVTLDDQHAQIAQQIPLMEKAHEVLKETLANVDNLRHQLVTRFAGAAEERARMEGGEPALLTAYEKTIAYRSIIADKAVKARKKNEEEKNGARPAGPTGPGKDEAPKANAGAAEPTAPANG